VGTVSATLNGTARVSEKLARRVRLAVSRVGYSPDGVAQSLRLGRTRTIGLVVSDVCNPFFASLSRSVEAAAESAGYALILCNTDEDPERELRLLSVLQMQRVAGVIFSPSGVDESYRERLVRLAGPPAPPAVLVDRTLPGLPFDAVTVDNREAGRLATEHLIRLGHRRIAIVSGRAGVLTAEERLAGYRESLARHRLASDESLVVTANFRAETAQAAVQRLLARPRLPTAILAANNP
jgi:LacI family transcriptional regulator, galactose operon repressor